MFNTYCIQQKGNQKVKQLQAEANIQRVVNPQVSQTNKPKTLNLYDLFISLFSKKAFN